MSATTRIACMLGVLSLATGAVAQGREPLCVTTQARRLYAGRVAREEPDERVVARAFRSTSAPARFVVAARESEPAGLRVLRLGADLRPVGASVLVADPVPARAPARPLGIALRDGVLVLELLAGEVYATTVAPTGAIAPPRRLAAAPHGHALAWLSATARGQGAIALAGTSEGEVLALRIGPDGALEGSPSAWTPRVGGPLELLPTGDGPAAALLGRPVRGTGMRNEQARVQVLVNLGDDLAPRGEPANIGLAQFPLASVPRERDVLVFQWVEQQGFALATLPIAAHRVAEQLPRLWYARPPLEGLVIGQDAVRGAGNVVYDVAAYGESAGGLHGHVAWVPPSGAPVVRRDVLPTRLRLAAPPALLPAEDGIVVVLAGEDETGAGIDALHVRCDLVAVPPSARR